MVTGTAWWADLPAAHSDRVWLVDGSGYFNRPGPRLVDGLEILAHILQPSLFPRTPKRNDAERWVGWWRNSTPAEGTPERRDSWGPAASRRTVRGWRRRAAALRCTP